VPGREPVFRQVNLVVRDMGATLAFYRRLGVAIDARDEAPHVAVDLPGGLRIEWDTVAFVPEWDTGWRGATGGSAILGFSVASREAVDVIYAELVATGHRGHQPPYDALWGARYAIVDDPDGNGIGLMSPIDPEQAFWPPSRPPSASDSDSSSS
jgi:predicted lactoylglutathione lyase